MDLNRIPENAEVWEKVIRKLRGGMMPPQGMPRPEQTAIDGLASWVEDSVDRASVDHGGKTTRNPGAVAVHRLNRTEYGKAIRGLLDLEIDPAALLPNDDESDGFDNMASVLKVSPSFLDQYISAADQVSALAVGDPAIASPKQGLSRSGHPFAVEAYRGLAPRHAGRIRAPFTTSRWTANTSSISGSIEAPFIWKGSNSSIIW